MKLAAVPEAVLEHESASLAGGCSLEHLPRLAIHETLVSIEDRLRGEDADFGSDHWCSLGRQDASRGFRPHIGAQSDGGNETKHPVTTHDHLQLGFTLMIISR